MKTDFKGKWAVVIGGSSGIGKELCKQLHDLGTTVYNISRSENQELECKGVINRPCDILNTKKLKENLEGLANIDFLINVAGTNLCEPVENISEEEWDRVLDTNLKSFFVASKVAMNKMKKGSRIVNVSSIAGRSKSLVSGVHYTASKAGIIGLTRQLAVEAGPKGINVNCTAPSQTITPMLVESMTYEQRTNLASLIPLRRLASPEDQVGPILFLLSSWSNYVNGAIIDVNGGQL